MLPSVFFVFVFTDTGLCTDPAADPVPHLGLIPVPVPGHFLHLAVDGFPIPAHVLDPGAALDLDPALLILMNTVAGEVEEGEHL